ncbi:MAG: hypothetical protein KKB66_16145 [Alphaproteobacteria bacterium]|nr:hypothetical protein [Alphaproteobacteria bacterium]MBU0804295.1 hypothetical protein [Alphaproteobacteria bacterium]MBU1400881.1 hypothetical protein [Alphaproteobacteria bacterium]MBU1592702.1 hypothetical protein [Alphaproteobacteria bacterium]MBU1789733.1 hypothetical protein [Alphaproteobacteria bacterium]
MSGSWQAADRQRLSIGLCGLAVVIAFLLLLACPVLAASQLPRTAHVLPDMKTLSLLPANDVRFRRLSLAQGLSQTRVAQIMQDDEGFIWFGTQHGVNRFDGYNFRVFKHDVGRAGSLSGVFIYALFNDSSGRVWVGSDQGLDRFEKETETFRHIRLGERDPIVIHISEGPRGKLWLATGQGLYRLDPDTGAVERFGADPDDPRSLSSDDIKSTGVDRTGTFWVATSEGLEAFDPETGEVSIRIPLRVEVREFYFHEDRHGVFWIIYGSGNGLATYDRQTNELTQLTFSDPQTESDGLTGVFAIVEAADGTIYLGTMGAGLLKYDRTNNLFLSYRHDQSNSESLAENRVIALFEDSEGNIWAGLHATPPNSFPGVAPLFETIRLPEVHPSASGEFLVNSIFAGAQDDVWIGSGGALTRLFRTTRKSEVVELLGPNVPMEVLTTIRDPRGNLWVGTLGTGLFRIDGATGAVTNFRYRPDDDRSLSSDIVTRIFFDRGGAMWLTTWNGLLRYDEESEGFTTFRRDLTAGAEPYFSIVEDAQGLLWLGSTSGLFRFDPKSSEFASFTHDPDNRKSISNNTINTLHLDADGILWIGTQNGLNAFDGKSGSVVRSYFAADGLPGEAVSCILADGNGDLWMSTNNGVSRFRRSTGVFSNFSTADGLPGNDLTGWNACSRNAQGEMYFGGFAGATVVRPDAPVAHGFTPPVLITELRLSGEPVMPGTPPLDGSVTYARNISIAPDVTEFSIAFSALSFSSPDTTRYRYRLRGLDSEWHEGKRRQVSFTTLPHGTYQLEVQAATARGAWTEPGAMLGITVLPPWWATWWFRSAVMAALALLLFGAYRYRIAQITHQYEIRSEERVMERTRIARELHDTLLQGFHGIMFRLQAARSMLPHDPAKATEHLEIAMDRGDQALIEGRDAVHELRATPLVDKDLPEVLGALASELAAAEPGRLNVEILVEGHSRLVNSVIRDELYRLAREALRNAFQHSNGSKVECELTYSDAALRLRVRDDGRGIDPQVLEEGMKAGHWGLPGMRERAERIGGTFTLWSKTGKGTELEVSIPAKLAYVRATQTQHAGRS